MLHNYKIIDLTHEVHADIPTWDMTCGFFLKTMRDYRHCDGVVKFRSQAFDIRASAGTHIDSPAHCFAGKRDVTGLSAEELVCPCVVIDVSDRAHERYSISVDDISAFEQAHGFIAPGTFVLFYTGWSRFWEKPKKYHNNLVFPHVSGEVAELLLQRNIVGIGTDTLSPDCGESVVHGALLSADKYIVENVAYANLMPPVGATVCIFPPRIKDAAESPVRMIGLVPQGK